MNRKASLQSSSPRASTEEPAKRQTSSQSQYHASAHPDLRYMETSHLFLINDGFKNTFRSLFCLCPLQALPLYKLSITEKVVQAVQSMLLPQEGSLSIHTSLPATGDGSSPVMAAVRLLAEIRTRSVTLPSVKVRFKIDVL